MTARANTRQWRLGVIGPIILVVAACTGGAPSPTLAPGAPSSQPADAFADLTYRLDLPADWIVLGSSSYDVTLDGVPDVANWLNQLDLVGPNALRAYEPLPGAAGLRIAINPPSPWRSALPVLRDAGLVATLPGVTGEPIGDMVGIGVAAKGTRFRWTQTLDWGSGTPSARTCVGYEVMGEFDPVNVVFSYPAETDRLADVEALMASFEVLGNPVASLPPGVTMPPSPTPYDKYGSPAPMATFHGDPALEALLPDSVDGVALTKESRTGVQMGLTDNDPFLAPFGKHPADLASASAVATQPPMLMVNVVRLRGVAADRLLAAALESVPGDAVSHVSLGGRQVTYVTYGAWPVWYYATGELLYGVAGLEETAAKVLAGLP